MGKNKYLFLAISLILIGIAGLLNAQEAPNDTQPKALLNPPEELTVFDAPNDSLGNISFSWKQMPYEKDDIFYVIYVSKTQDGPFDKEIIRFSSTQKWKKEKKWPFWVGGKKEGYHYIEVNPSQSKYFMAPTIPELNKKRDELREFQKKAEEAKKANKDYPEIETQIKNLQKDIKVLQDKINTEKDEFKNASYFFKIGVIYYNNTLALSPAIKCKAENNWFNFSLLNNFIVMLVFCSLVLWFINHAKKNQNLFLRRITGLDAVEEAVGRATEMGRPIFYLTGIGGMSDISTIAATVILGKVAEKIALYDTQIRVPHRDPIVMTVCQETVKEAYIKAGRPDAYKEDCNFFVTSDQFSYTASVNGMMVREKPAANFFMGSYMAEALLLAEVGAMTGAIQIAGTDSTSQLPFFITACDYTLIGEELYAASAYLSREPVLVGTLKAQDIGKGVLLAALAIGSILTTLNINILLDLIKDFS